MGTSHCTAERMGKPSLATSNPGVEKLKGVFSAPSFTTVGDPYMKKSDIWPRLKGKNKISGVPKKVLDALPVCTPPEPPHTFRAELAMSISIASTNGCFRIR